MTAKGEQLAVVVEAMKINNQEHKEMKDALLRIENKLDKKADKEEFIFWRNLLVSGMLLAIALGVWFK